MIQEPSLKKKLSKAMVREAIVREPEEDLNGAWILVAMNTTFACDPTRPIPNPGSTGAIVYNTNPAVQSVQAMVDKPPFTEDPQGLSFAYSGQYEITEYDPATRSGKIIHHIEQERTTILTNPDGSEKKQGALTEIYDMPRQFQLSADGQELTITGPGKKKREGMGSTIAILWARAVQPERSVIPTEAESNIASASGTPQEGIGGPFSEPNG